MMHRTFFCRVMCGLGLMLLGGSPPGLCDSATNLLGPLSQMSDGSGPGWNFELRPPTQGVVTQDAEALRCVVTTVDGTAPDVKLCFQDVHLAEGQAYSLRFRARADYPRLLRVYGVNGQGKDIGLDEMVHLTTDWKDYRAAMTAHDVAQGACTVQFEMGQNPGTVWIGGAALTAGTAPQQADTPAVPALPPSTRSLVLRTLDKAQAQMTPDGAAMKTTVTVATGTVWHVQVALPDVPLEEGRAYTLTFRAKADAPRSALVVAQSTDDYHNIGLNRTEALTTDWKIYAETFTAKQLTPKPNELQFQLAKESGTFWLSGLRLTGPGIETALEAAGATPPAAAPSDAGTDERPRRNEIGLRGTVTRVNVAERRVLLNVVAVSQPDGSTATLASPRPKTVLVGTGVTFLPDGATLAALNTGTVISVIGQDSGTGKPLTARLLHVATP